jgi:UDP-N-acetylmuramoyl-L-alanyl-D-glutamate--2,6-diaminopimelate ligase
MAPKLSDYIQEGEIVAARGTLDRPISGLAMDSRRVVPGSLFFALPGLRTDGGTYIDQAIDRGAVAIVTNKLPSTMPAKVTFIQVEDPRAILARVSQRYYKFPDREMQVIGVTGTNGKTTVTHLLKHLLGGDQRVGLLGTISYDLGVRTVPSFKTTPEAIDIFGMLAQMRDAGCRQAVMEVSSHGIDQKRVLGMQFDAAVFTNLTRDHLDYHQTLDAYFAAKARLFTGEVGSTPKVAVINLDDTHGAQLASVVPEGVKVVTYGESPEALVRAEEVSLNFKNTTFKLVWPEGSMCVDSPLIGHYNVSNLLAAVATAWGLGRDPSVIMARLKSFAGVSGRLERIDIDADRGQRALVAGDVDGLLEAGEACGAGVAVGLGLVERGLGDQLAAQQFLLAELGNRQYSGQVASLLLQMDEPRLLAQLADRAAVKVDGDDRSIHLESSINIFRASIAVAGSF